MRPPVQLVAAPGAPDFGTLLLRAVPAGPADAAEGAPPPLSATLYREVISRALGIPRGAAAGAALPARTRRQGPTDAANEELLSVFSSDGSGNLSNAGIVVACCSVAMEACHSVAMVGQRGSCLLLGLA